MLSDNGALSRMISKFMSVSTWDSLAIAFSIVSGPKCYECAPKIHSIILYKVIFQTSAIHITGQTFYINQ